MADQIYRYSGPPGTPPPYGDPFVVKDGWADWLKRAWIAALAANGYGGQVKSWIPTYESGKVTWPGNDGAVHSLPVERFFLVTQDTAEQLAARFGVNGKSLTILPIPFFDSVERYLQWPNGKFLAANQLAQFYTNNPEDQYPGLALHLSQLLIQQVWP